MLTHSSLLYVTDHHHCPHHHHYQLFSTHTSDRQVTYSGVVEWTSEKGVFISFPDREREITDNTSLTLSPLTPSTAYVFSVSVVTPNGQGEAVSLDYTTTTAVGGKEDCKMSL